MGTEIWISCRFHVSWNITLLLIFFPQLFKNVRNILSEWAICKQVAGWIWPVGHSSQGMFFLQISAGQGLSLSSLCLNVTCLRLIQTSPFNPAPPSLVASTFSVSFTLLPSFLFACACQPLTCYTIYLLCVHCVLMSLTPPPVWVGLFALFIGCIANAEISASYLMGPQYIVVDWVSMINIYLLVIVFRLWWFLLLYTSDNEYYENNDTWNWPEVTGQASWRRWHLNWL